MGNPQQPTATEKRRQRAAAIRRINAIGDPEIRALAFFELGFRDLRALQWAWARFVEPYEPKPGGR